MSKLVKIVAGVVVASVGVGGVYNFLSKKSINNGRRVQNANELKEVDEKFDHEQMQREVNERRSKAEEVKKKIQEASAVKDNQLDDVALARQMQELNRELQRVDQQMAKQLVTEWQADVQSVGNNSDWSPRSLQREWGVREYRPGSIEPDLQRNDVNFDPNPGAGNYKNFEDREMQGKKKESIAKAGSSTMHRSLSNLLPFPSDGSSKGLQSIEDAKSESGKKYGKKDVVPMGTYYEDLGSPTPNPLPSFLEHAGRKAAGYPYLKVCLNDETFTSYEDILKELEDRKDEIFSIEMKGGIFTKKIPKEQHVEFFRFKNLQEVSISGESMLHKDQDSFISSLLTKCPELKTLEWDSDFDGVDDIFVLYKIFNHPKLEHMSFPKCKIKEEFFLSIVRDMDFFKKKLKSKNFKLYLGCLDFDLSPNPAERFFKYIFKFNSNIVCDFGQRKLLANDDKKEYLINSFYLVAMNFINLDILDINDKNFSEIRDRVIEKTGENHDILNGMTVEEVDNKFGNNMVKIAANVDEILSGGLSEDKIKKRKKGIVKHIFFMRQELYRINSNDVTATLLNEVQERIKKDFPELACKLGFSVSLHRDIDEGL